MKGIIFKVHDVFALQYVYVCIVSAAGALQFLIWLYQQQFPQQLHWLAQASWPKLAAHLCCNDRRALCDKLERGTHLTDLEVLRHQCLLDFQLPRCWSRTGGPSRTAARGRSTWIDRWRSGQPVQNLPELLHLYPCVYTLTFFLNNLKMCRRDG